jgi:hypothetical protein
MGGDFGGSDDDFDDDEAMAMQMQNEYGGF